MQADAPTRAMWNDPATSRLMFRLSWAAACAYGGLSMLLSSTYTLYGDNGGHPLGHLLPFGTAFATALWGLQCALLHLADRSLRREAWALSLRFALAGASAWICDHRHWHQT